MGVISSTNGTEILIDPEYVELLNKYSWRVVKGYAIHRFQISGQQTSYSLHRFIFEVANRRQLTRFEIVDHINHNRLDNRISNLRKATPTESTWNRKYFKRNKSGYVGVCFVPKYRKYQVMISGRYLGVFDCPIVAAKRYDDECLKLRGSFAILNFPERNGR